MANSLYDAGRVGYLGGDSAWDTDDNRIIFIDEADDTIDLTNDDFLNDRAAAARVATSGALAGKSMLSTGVADANDITVTAVSGDQFESIDCYTHTGVESTSRMIFNIDTATGLPMTPAGTDITVTWDSGASRIFKL